MALKVSLKPGESLVVNGAWIVNGPKRAALIFQNRAKILREKDLMRSDQVDTPQKKLYYWILQQFLGDTGHAAASTEWMKCISEISEMHLSRDQAAQLSNLTNDIVQKEYYRALLTCRSLFEIAA